MPIKLLTLQHQKEKSMNNLVFLKPFSIKNPTLDEQNAFMTREIVNEVECASLGKFYNNDTLYGKNLKEFITTEVLENKPEWIIAEGECASITLGIKNHRKILINPKVSFDDLNNVPVFARNNTYGFFDDRHEQDYEIFQSVYPHAAWFPQDDDLTLFTIKEIVEEIKNG